MLRPDFPEIFDFLTYRATGYSINTNGTLITPEIAQLLKRKGAKMIAMYGATPEVYDAVTRNPGGFEKMMAGLELMRQAGAEFTVQLIPMRANWHQWPEMLALAKSLSSTWRVGAPWLYLSSDGTPQRNAEIAAQRLPPHDEIELDSPPHPAEDQLPGHGGLEPCFTAAPQAARLFASCIAAKTSFHIDPYGQMSWCAFIKDPALRYDLRSGSVRQAWEEFIPSCADKVHGGEEWRTGCGTCRKRSSCRWCAVYSYLESGRYSAPLPYLCRMADEAVKYQEEWQADHRRYFQIAGITVRLESDLNLSEISFKPELASFSAEGPGTDNVTIHHSFLIPDLKGKDLGQEIYSKTPWVISRSPRDGLWYYRGVGPDGADDSLHRVAVFKADHTHAAIYSPPHDADQIRKNGWWSLSLFPTDQIWLAPLLADRSAALIHSSAAIVNGQGLVFVGHSSAGKSTTVRMLQEAARRPSASMQVEILCDDRNVVRRWPEGWRVHGTWSHGDVPDVSGASAPLRAILFLEQDQRNVLIPLLDRKQIWKRLLATLIKPAVTAEWWQKELAVLEQIVSEVPCYTMFFDQSGGIVPHLVELTLLTTGVG